jgi:pyrimidine operon attenuation protein/uracil phosphoribosyltransferase
MQTEGRLLLEKERFKLCIERLCYQLIEHHSDLSNVCLMGIQPRGTYFSDRVHTLLKSWFPDAQLQYGKLDITFFRDDFRMRAKPLSPNETIIDFLVQDKEVILLDDVLYTGRSIQAALTALQHYGRPSQVKLMTLVDRRFNRELPIEPHYTGLTVDALDNAYVKVEWEERDGEDKVILFSKKESN